jgi:hypothetical protein
MEILKRLCEAVRRKRPELRPNDSFLHRDHAPPHKVFSAKQFLAQKSITEMENPRCSHNLAPNDFWLLPKMKSALKGRNFQDKFKTYEKMWRQHWKLFHNRSSRNVSNSGSIVGLSA